MKDLRKFGMQTKKVIEHVDVFGYKLKVGDTVAYPKYSYIHIGIVKKLNRVKIKVWDVKNNWKWYNGDTVIAKRVIKVPEKDVSLYILKQKG